MDTLVPTLEAMAYYHKERVLHAAIRVKSEALNLSKEELRARLRISTDEFEATVALLESEGMVETKGSVELGSQAATESTGVVGKLKNLIGL